MLRQNAQIAFDIADELIIILPKSINIHFFDLIIPIRDQFTIWFWVHYLLAI